MSNSKEDARVLEVRNLKKHFGGVRAVDGVDFTVDAGELVALIGPNGAGKSTCFNLINGQLRPDAGEILLDGRNVAGLPPRELCRLGVGRTFQVAATFSSMTVRENLKVAVGFTGEVEKLLEQIQMQTLADHPCSTLAYGDLKRVELGLALATQPRLLLMDEPTAGMAAAEHGALMDLVERLARERKVAVLFTEHDMDVVFGHADRVLVLAEGKLLAQGMPDEIRAHPQVRAVYLGEEAADA